MPKQIGRDFAGGISKCIFLKDNIEISIKISPKFFPKCLFDNIPAMAWRRSGDKPLSESMMVSFVTHICVTQPQWATIW